MSTQPLSRELATKRPANAPARPQSRPQVVDGEARPTRPTGVAGVFGWFGLVVVGLLFAGFLLSMWQQAS